MTRTEGSRRGRSLGALVFFVALGLLAAGAAAIATAFNVGYTTGLMAAGTTVLVYQVPAIVFDWPRITFEHVLDFFGFLWDLISSLWDW